MIKIIIGILISSVAFAATTGTLLLSGNIAPTVSISVTGVGQHNNLDFTTTATDFHVANVLEKSNVSTGYKVTIASANAGQLKNGSAGQIAYTAKYNGTSFSLSTTPVTVTNVTSQTNVANSLKQVSISFSGIAAESVMSGTYSDTLTFTISTN